MRCCRDVDAGKGSAAVTVFCENREKTPQCLFRDARDSLQFSSPPGSGWAKVTEPMFRLYRFFSLQLPHGMPGLPSASRKRMNRVMPSLAEVCGIPRFPVVVMAGWRETLWLLYVEYNMLYISRFVFRKR